MGKDMRVDAKIAEAAAFARPILDHLRALVHTACPEAEETIKWGRPFFTIGGRPIAFMAAFKAHAAFGFWQSMASGREPEAAGQFGRLTSLADLPPDEKLIALIRHAGEAMRTERTPASRKAARPAAEVPPDLGAALDGSAAARACFDRLPPSQRRDYVEWVTGAKRPETRSRRIEKAIEQLAEGKDRNAAYR